MTILEAKRDLYNKLRKKSDAVIGAGIKKTPEGDAIVILLDAKDEGSVAVPKTYKGNKVLTQTGTIPKKMD